MSRSRLIEMTRHSIEHAKADTLEQQAEIFRVPASHYTDPDRWQREVDLVFKRMPLMLATSTELKDSGAYKAMTVLGMPVLLHRGSDGTLRAFVNMCSHRGAQLMPEGLGKTRTFVCPYHAWAYDEKGTLKGVFSANDFGVISPSR